ncbi:tetratricopeptide repeat protein [Nostoc punctiforme UO1]|uniref:nSTAND1 domain-containing NTPase n=1 Tax=Nostoc punctiforme TaxID=272131 RepID=UPI0030B2AF09
MRKAIGDSLPDLSLESEVETLVEHLTQYICSLKEERVVLVIDQFEECFTLCKDEERKKFFNCLLDVLERLKDKFCLVLGIRADFYGRFLEYGKLGNKIVSHQVSVQSMTEIEIEEAIKKPSEKVGLKVETALVEAMKRDVIDYPGSLPLLQSALTELWEETQKDTNPNRNRLMLETYIKLGEQKSDQKESGEQEYNRKKTSGIEKIFSNKADEVFNALSNNKDKEKPNELSKEQLVAQRIFLELVQIGEVTHTRRRVLVDDLKNQVHSPELLDPVIEKLVDERLITTNDINGKRVLDLVHESLIRHWPHLRELIKTHEDVIKIERKIEAKAKDWDKWKKKNKNDDPGLLLQGAALAEAEEYLEKYRHLGLLDGIAEKYVERSQEFREEQQESQKKQIAELKQALAESQMHEQSTRVLNLLPVESSEALALAIDTMGLNFQQLPKESQSSLEDLAQYTDQILGVVQFSLHEVMTKVRLLNIFGKDSSYIKAVAFSPDGKTIMSGSSDNPLQLWDIYGNHTGQSWYGHRDDITAVAFSPDGNSVVFGSDDNTLQLWDINGNQISEPWQGHEDVVEAIAFSPDGQMIASGSRDKTVRLWDINGNPIGDPLYGHESDVKTVAFSPDGKMIVSGSEGQENNLCLWDINKHLQKSGINQNPLMFFRNLFKALLNNWMIEADAKTKRYRDMGIIFDKNYKIIPQLLCNALFKWFKRFEKSNAQLWCSKHENINAVAFSPDGKMIVSGSKGRDKNLCLWDIKGNQIDKLWQGHEDSINAVAFSRNGKIIVSGGDDKTIRLWDIDGNTIGEPLRGHESSVNAVAFSPDGQMIVSGGNDNLRLWDINSNLIVNQLREPKNYSLLSSLHKDGVNALAFSPDGQTIVSGGNDNLHLWKIRNKDEDDVIPVVLELYTVSISITAVAFSPDGQKIVSGSKSMYSLSPNTEDRYSISDESKDNTLFDKSQDNTLCLWDINGTQIGEPWQGHEGPVSAVAFSPDGQKIISGSWDNTLRLWDINGNQIGEPWQGHEGAVTAVSFSSDGQMVVSGSWDKTLRLWSINGKAIGQPLCGHNGIVNAVAFSPDGQIIVSGSDDNTLRLWDVNGNSIGQPWRGHEDSVNAVAFSPDGQIIVSGSKDTTLRLWDINGNQIAEPLHGHNNIINAVAFSPDGQTIISGSSGRDNNLLLWPAGNWQRWLKVCCDRFAHHLIWKYPEIDLVSDEKDSGLVRVASERNPQQTDVTIVSPNDENITTHNQSPEILLAQRACEICKKYIWTYADLSKISRQQVNTLASRVQVEEAMAKFQKAKEYNPTLELDSQSEVGKLAASTLVNQGRKLAKELDRDGAMAKFQKAKEYNPTLELDPQAEVIKLVERSKVSQQNLAHMFAEHRQGILSELDIPKYLARRIQKVSTLLEERKELAKKEDIDGAIAKLQQAITIFQQFLKLSPQSTELRNLTAITLVDQGGLLASKGHIDEALTQFQQALELDPQNAIKVQVLVYKGALLASKGYIDEALAQFQQALELDPQNAEARNLTAEVLVDQGGLLASKGHIDEALAQFQQALELDPQNAIKVQTLVDKGELLASKGQIDEAIAQFQQALELDPQNAEVRKLIAYALLHKGGLLVKEGQIDEAIAHYDQAQAFEPTLEISAYFWNQLCWCGTLHGYANNPKVMAAGEKAVTLEPLNGAHRDTRGLSRVITGNTNGAIEDFQAFINWTDKEEEKLQRQSWIDTLRAGENPITPEKLNKLLNSNQ